VSAVAAQDTPGAPAARPAQRAELLGCPLDPIGFEEAASRAVGWCFGERRAHTLVTANAAVLVALRKDAALARACRAGDLVVADGVPVVWASRLAGRPLPGRVAGVDLMARLLEAGSDHRLKAFFLGAREEVVRALVALCATRWPGLVVAGWRNGYFGPAQEAELVEDIRRSGADMLFVGMPTPFKEIWCERHRDALGVPLVMGVGGSFDVLAGFIRRAPRWMQGAGLEWLWRLAMEPRRLWRRYLVTNALFVGGVLREALRRRRSPRAEPGAT
jgi:N-acetylglucosaminyldiphosphoundecaprenol N-acetyl-beta-D-mannosaminyltransferase